MLLGMSTVQASQESQADHFDLIAGTGTGGLIAIMLGRLRLDIETCKDVYVRMTRKVFETDKTIAGIPYRSTLFKASKLEEAIKECVREHTIFEDEGNDVLANATPMNSSVGQPLSPVAPERNVSNASTYSRIGNGPVNPRVSAAAARWGNPNAVLYDTRENRTKTAVTAVYKGTSTSRSKTSPAALLRSYDSRKEPAPEFECTIWQAGRATAATALAFKPIQIGQSIFLDEGAGKYNPSPQILDEAVCNEWPGREVGVFVSIGTGKRPSGTNSQQHLWWEDFVGSSMGDFAEARRKLINKIEGCEETHTFMMHKHLHDRNVNPENYYRFNVEVGVGEFGMNEWNRLSDISTSTRMYLAKKEIQDLNIDASAKMARIHFAKRRHERHLSGSSTASYLPSPNPMQPSRYDAPLPAVPSSHPGAIELPAEDVMPMLPRPLQYQHHASVADMKYSVITDDYPPPLNPGHPQSPNSAYQQYQQRPSIDNSSPHHSNSSLHSTSSPQRVSFDYRNTNSNSSDYNSDYRSNSLHNRSSPPNLTSPTHAPPIPPKTPLQVVDRNDSTRHQQHFDRNDSVRQQVDRNDSMRRWEMGGLRNTLPYPDADGPPPPVNLGRKPEYGI